MGFMHSFVLDLIFVRSFQVACEAVRARVFRGGGNLAASQQGKYRRTELRIRTA